MGEENKLYTFWELLSEKEIIIPKIQRDYAQGRVGKKVEVIRNSILDDFQDVLMSSDKNLNLDFVYGSNESNQIVPLDGQQRLTTLFLLHLYLAKISRNCGSTNQGIFKQFKYEIRSSTQKFISSLIENEYSEDIENQSWFFNSWKKDPTVQGMLVMLQSIHEKFKNYPNLWSILEKERKITFYFLPLNKFKLTDELYVKMNSRGKPLSDFENFKAWLDEKLTLIEGFDSLSWSLKLDTTWTDLFWNNDNGDYSIDDEMMNFFRGMAIFTYINKANVTESYKSDFEKRIGELNDIDKVYLSNKEFDAIYFKGAEAAIFSDISKFLNSYYQKEAVILELLKRVNFWEEGGENLFRRFINKPTYTERALFYGMYQYVIAQTELLNNQAESERFFRVLRNFIENSDVNASTIKNIFSSIDILAQQTDILKFVSTAPTLVGFNGAQIQEEQIKAELIIKDELSWENEIKNAENHSLFRGSIGFLLNEKIDENQFDYFLELYQRAAVIFSSNGISDQYRENTLFLRAFISQMTTWDQLYDFQYDSERDSWKKVLQNNKLRSLLIKTIQNDIEQYEKWIYEDSQIRDINLLQIGTHETIYKSKLLNVVQHKCLIRWVHNKYILAPKGASADWKVYVLNTKRNFLLSQLINDINIDCQSEQKLGDIDHFWGWNINFTYKEKQFTWKWKEDNEIWFESNHLVIEDWDNIESLKSQLDGLLEIVPQDLQVIEFEKN